MGLFDGHYRVLKKRRGLVEVKLRFSAARYGQVLQDFCLEGCAKPFHGPDAVLFCCRLKFGERRNPELLVQLQDFVGANSRDGKKLEHAVRHFLAQLLKARMGPRFIKLGDDVGYGVADPRNLGEGAGLDDAVERLQKSAEALGRLEIRFRAVRIAAPK